MNAAELQQNPPPLDKEDCLFSLHWYIRALYLNPNFLHIWIWGWKIFDATPYLDQWIEVRHIHQFHMKPMISDDISKKSSMFSVPFCSWRLVPLVPWPDHTHAAIGQMIKIMSDHNWHQTTLREPTFIFRTRTFETPLALLLSRPRNRYRNDCRLSYPTIDEV